ncbi:hypothetical protein ACFU7Y_32080 [Kitasatospora sp. NPDC057542]|uniref:hypothetical protein n=1 Tax=Kitasatospora sp. NPDC057542 TaxID=3346162 RepID=UPI00369CEA41
MAERTAARQRRTSHTTPPRTPAPRNRDLDEAPRRAGQERPARRDPGRMSGAVLASVGSSLLITAVTFLAQHIEVTWH